MNVSVDKEYVTLNNFKIPSQVFKVLQIEQGDNEVVYYLNYKIHTIGNNVYIEDDKNKVKLKARQFKNIQAL